MREIPDRDRGASQHTHDDTHQHLGGSSTGGLDKAMGPTSGVRPTPRITAEPPRVHKSQWSTWSTVLRRRRYVDQVKRPLTPLEGAHGALFESVVVQGLPGSGKRTIALQAAEEICSRDGRTLLVVNGRTFETFVPSYLNTYYTLTGTHLPAGEHWFYALYNLKHYLDRHRTQWLMVILDIDRHLDKGLDNPGRTLAWFLPNRGQLIMTERRYNSLTARIRTRAAADATLVSVKMMEWPEIVEFARSCCPELLGLREVDGGRMGTFGHTPLSLTILAANLMLLDMTFQSYHRLFTIRDRERRRSLKTTETWLFDPEDVHRDILWETLANRDRWSVRLLAALTFVDPWEIPIELVGRLAVFRDTISDRLSPALGLLQSLNILKLSEKHIWVDPTFHVWLREYVFKRYDLQEWLVLRSQWACVFLEVLAERELRVGGFYSCWMLGPHIHILDQEIMRHRDWSDLKLLEFLSKASTVAVFRAQILKHAQTCIRHAQSMPTILSAAMSSVETLRVYNYAQARVRLASAVVYADGPGELTRAESELRSAKLYIGRLKTHERHQQLLETSWLIDVHIMLCQNKPGHAEGFVDLILTSGEQMSERTRTKLHHAMAKCLEEQAVYATALQHSHEAMAYWFYRIDPLRFPSKSKSAIMVVETHINILIRLRKYRGALLYILPLLDLKITNAPQHSPSVWKLAKQAVMCYSSLHDVEKAEKLVYRVLCSATDGGLKEGVMYEIAYDIPDDFVLLYFDMLYLVAGLYLRKGRIIEADGLLRYILGVGSPRLSKNGPVPSVWWQDLMMCLYLRNDHVSLAQVSAEYKLVYDVDFTIRDIDDLVAGIEQTTDLYQRSLWAAEDGWLDEWKECVLISDQRNLQFAIAQDLFGEPELRVEDGRDFASDVGFGDVARAKRNKLLHLVGFDVVDLVFVSKLAALPPSHAQESAESEVEAVPVLPPSMERTSRAVIGQFLPHSQTDGEEVKVAAQGSSAAQTDEAAGEQNASAGGSGSSTIPPANLAEDENKQDFDEATATASASLQADSDKKPKRAGETSSKQLQETRRLRSDRDDQSAHTFKLHIMEIWANPYHQRTLPEYWQWCYCRRHRNRSGSINPVDLIDKRFLRELAETFDDTKKTPELIQKKITDCFLLLPPEPKPLPRGCHNDCPCHKANAKGAEEWAKLLQRPTSWPEDDPALDPKAYSPNAVYSGKPRPNGRFVKPLRPPPALLLNEIFMCDNPRRPEYICTPSVSDDGNSNTSNTPGGDNHANCSTPTATQPAPPPPSATTTAQPSHTNPAAQSASSASPSTPPPRSPTPPLPDPQSDFPRTAYYTTRCNSPEVGTTWMWLQPEFTPSDYPNENYLIHGSLSIPCLSITLTEDCWALPGTPMEKLWYWKPVSLLESGIVFVDEEWEEEGADAAAEEADEAQEVPDIEEEDGQGRQQNAEPKNEERRSRRRRRRSSSNETVEFRILTKRKETIDEYFMRERRFTAKMLREQEKRLADRDGYRVLLGTILEAVEEEDHDEEKEQEVNEDSIRNR